MEFCGDAAKVCEFFTGARIVLSAWILRIANGAARLQRGACVVGLNEIHREGQRSRRKTTDPLII